MNTAQMCTQHCERFILQDAWHNHQTLWLLYTCTANSAILEVREDRRENAWGLIHSKQQLILNSCYGKMHFTRRPSSARLLHSRLIARFLDANACPSLFNRIYYLRAARLRCNHARRMRTLCSWCVGKIHPTSRVVPFRAETITTSNALR